MTEECAIVSVFTPRSRRPARCGEFTMKVNTTRAPRQPNGAVVQTRPPAEVEHFQLLRWIHAADRRQVDEVDAARAGQRDLGVNIALAFLTSGSRPVWTPAQQSSEYHMIYTSFGASKFPSYASITRSFFYWQEYFLHATIRLILALNYPFCTFL